MTNTTRQHPHQATKLPLTESKNHLEIKNLSITYHTKKILENISMMIPRHSITAIIGPSGCGKSSFLSCINRLIDLTPKTQFSGEIYFNQHPVLNTKSDLILLRKKIGTIFQKPNPFPMSIKKNIQIALKEHGTKDSKELDRITRQVLQDVGLYDEVSDRLNDSALHLSGGQQQRLCIARAIALQPELLLMDEPCSALDPISINIIENLITRLSKQYTILIVTHNLAQARRISSSTAVFWPTNGIGELIEYGATEQIFEQPKNQITADYIRGYRA
ncbi:MAG: phosphate ABC transporter ATP-binding protein [Methylococcales bacterium]|jgi:phosphate transport system ATP-binding protein|nr:phosphate ABC transporter ATP-binding protein [Methylococcales bacterium]MBT7410985.1 phosphate ABC transporter ATP-binding protein [Methylococcales bacterium]